MIKGLSAIGLMLVGLVTAFPQEKEDPQNVLDKALFISLEVKVVDSNSKAVMTLRTAKVAMSGAPFPVRFDGRSIRGKLLFTPYEEPDDRVLLVAQVQLWILESPATEWKYVTSLKSIPAALNEKIRFFPLGMDDKANTVYDSANIELDIEVGRYKDYLERMKRSFPRGGLPWSNGTPPGEEGSTP